MDRQERIFRSLIHLASGRALAFVVGIVQLEGRFQCRYERAPGVANSSGCLMSPAQHVNRRQPPKVK